MERQEEGCPFSLELHNMELRVQEAMKAQDSRFQAMLGQVLQAVSQGPQLAATSGAYPLPSEMGPAGAGEMAVDLTKD